MEHKAESGDKQCFKLEYMFLGSILLILMVVYVEYTSPDYGINAPAPAFSWNQVRCLRKCCCPLVCSCRNKRDEGSRWKKPVISSNMKCIMKTILTWSHQEPTMKV